MSNKYDLETLFHLAEAKKWTYKRAINVTPVKIGIVRFGIHVFNFIPVKIDITRFGTHIFNFIPIKINTTCFGNHIFNFIPVKINTTRSGIHIFNFHLLDDDFMRFVNSLTSRI
jgi:hypothetical protein